MPRGRKAIEVDPIKFQQVIDDLENRQTFESWTRLFDAVAQTEWARSFPRPLTAQTARLRAEALGIRVKTPKGKSCINMVRPPKSTRSKRKVDPATVERIRDGFPSHFRSIVDRIGKGSLKAAVKAKCLECSAFQVSEIKHCTVTLCPLFPVRPYQDAETSDRTPLPLLA